MLHELLARQSAGWPGRGCRRQMAACPELSPFLFAPIFLGSRASLPAQPSFWRGLRFGALRLRSFASATDTSASRFIISRSTRQLGPPLSTEISKVGDPQYWCRRAEEARTVAGELTDPDAKCKMLKIAETYEPVVGTGSTTAAPPFIHDDQELAPLA
jgi:hypothetical protein